MSLTPAVLQAEVEASRSAFDVYGRLSDLHIEDLVVVDWGAGKRNSAISIQLRDMPFRSLVSIEAYQPSAWFLQVSIVAARTHTVIQESIVTHSLRREDKSCDVSLILDVLEHLDTVQADLFLKEIERVTRKRILIWLPIGDCPQAAKNGNQYEVHQSTWSVADLERRGYRVTLYKDFHTHIFPDRAVDAAWAVKDL